MGLSDRVEGVSIVGMAGEHGSEGLAGGRDGVEDSSG
jgi:hypothetical protein